MNPKEAIQNLISRMADNAFILGHRNAEWTGIGPTLEEDIAFSSMAQDKIGHAFQLYTLMHKYMGGLSPDDMGFNRTEKEFLCCQFVELYTNDYAYALIRHYLYDHAEAIRYQLLRSSSFRPLADLAKKIAGEIKYHTMHADLWMKKLTLGGNEESKARMQTALNEAWPYALGLFEITEAEESIMQAKVFTGEEDLKSQWMAHILPAVERFGLRIPAYAEPVFGGAKGFHSHWLSPLLEEMTEVFRTDVSTEW